MEDNVFVEYEYECLWAVTVEYITGSVRLGNRSLPLTMATGLPSSLPGEMSPWKSI